MGTPIRCPQGILHQPGAGKCSVTLLCPLEAWGGTGEDWQEGVLMEEGALLVLPRLRKPYVIPGTCQEGAKQGGSVAQAEGMKGPQLWLTIEDPPFCGSEKVLLGLYPSQ